MLYSNLLCHEQVFKNIEWPQLSIKAILDCFRIWKVWTIGSLFLKIKKSELIVGKVVVRLEFIQANDITEK